jgi:hypothetical protein
MPHTLECLDRVSRQSLSTPLITVGDGQALDGRWPPGYTADVLRAVIVGSTCKLPLPCRMLP